MDQQYDAIVLGTGLKECILSGLLSVNGYKRHYESSDVVSFKVLHMDRNSFYGGESASVNLTQLFEKFRPDAKPSTALGQSREYNVDLIPKFIMAAGNLVKLLIHADVTRYLNFKCVDGSYIFKDKKIHKVPSSAGEAFKSPLMGFFEKRRCGNFLEWVQAYDTKNAKTWGKIEKCNPKTCHTKDLIKYWDLEADTVDFLGHAVALYSDENYINSPAEEFIERIQLYWEGIARYEKSAFIYPLYGLGELPQAFARLAAVCGGTYMLNKPVQNIVYNTQGEACGVTSEGETAGCKFVVGDPSYFPDKVKKTGQVVRAICILNHPVADTNNSESAQIIVPAKQVGRKSDIYISVISFAHDVAPKGKWISIVACTVETANAQKEIEVGMSLLTPIEEKFIYVSDTFAPLADGTKDKCFISESYDATSHFETATTDVLKMYKRITGKDVDLNARPRQAATAGEQE